MTQDHLAELVRDARSATGLDLFVVAVDGLGGAGKSTLADELASRLGAQVVHTDDFATWDEPLEWWPRLLDQVLRPLSQGRVARFARYDSQLWKLAEWHEIEPNGFVIVEGVSSSREEFTPFLDYSIWVQTPQAERLRRGLTRDGEQAREQWMEWMRHEDEWAARKRPRERANVIVSGELL